MMEMFKEFIVAAFIGKKIKTIEYNGGDDWSVVLENGYGIRFRIHEIIQPCSTTIGEEPAVPLHKQE